MRPFHSSRAILTAAALALFPIYAVAGGPEEAAGKPLTLRQSIEQALANNLDIVVQKAKPLASEQDYIAAEAQFDPSLFGSFSYGNTQSPSSSPYSNPAVSETKMTVASIGVQQKFSYGTSYKLTLDSTKADTNSLVTTLNPSYTSNLDLSLTQPLLKNSGKDPNTYQLAIAKNARGISDADFSSKVMDVVTKTEQTYWDLVAAKHDLAVQEEALRWAKDFKRQIELKVQVGVLAPIEVAAADAQVAVQEEVLIKNRLAIRNTQDSLKGLINSNELPLGGDDGISPTDEPAFKETPLDLQSLRETAYDKRPDYRQAQLALDSKQTERAYNENQTLPTLNLVADVKLHSLRGEPQTVTIGGQAVTSNLGGTQTDSLSDAGGGKYYDYSVGMQFEYPLFNRAAKSRAVKSQVEADAARMTLATVRQAIDLQVLAAARSVEAALQTIEATRLSRVLAEKKLAAETRKFEVGTSTSFTVLQYQKDLAAAKSNEMKAATDCQKAVAQLGRATGTILERNNITLTTQGQ